MSAASDFVEHERRPAPVGRLVSDIQCVGQRPKSLVRLGNEN